MKRIKSSQELAMEKYVEMKKAAKIGPHDGSKFVPKAWRWGEEGGGGDGKLSGCKKEEAGRKSNKEVDAEQEMNKAV